MKQEQIMGIIRHVLTFVGGIVVAKGFADETFVMELTGGIITLVGGIWSIVSKIKTEK